MLTACLVLTWYSKGKKVKMKRFGFSLEMIFPWFGLAGNALKTADHWPKPGQQSTYSARVCENFCGCLMRDANSGMVEMSRRQTNVEGKNEEAHKTGIGAKAPRRPLEARAWWPGRNGRTDIIHGVSGSVPRSSIPQMRAQWRTKGMRLMT